MKLLFLAILLAQGAGERVINGVVVDAEGKGVGGARIVFGGSAVAPDRNAVIAVQGSSDADGSFRLTIPRIGMALAREVNLWHTGRGSRWGPSGLHGRLIASCCRGQAADGQNPHCRRRGGCRRGSGRE